MDIAVEVMDAMLYTAFAIICTIAIYAGIEKGDPPLYLVGTIGILLCLFRLMVALNVVIQIPPR